MYNQFIPNYNRRNDRFSGNFAIPFILGGIAGSIWNTRPIVFYQAPPYFPIYYQRFF